MILKTLLDLKTGYFETKLILNKFQVDNSTNKLNCLFEIN